MADPIPLSLNKTSAPSRFQSGGDARLVNGFAEEIGAEGRVTFALYCADGLQGFAALDGITTGIRAALEVDGALYAVAGTQLWKIQSNGNVTSLGSMSISATAPIYMARNRRSTPDIAVVCDGTMYNYRTSLAQVTDADLLAPMSLTVVDGIFIIGTADNKWQAGEIDDATAWDALSFERADASPDPVVRVYNRQNEALIFGERTCEFWTNAGLADATGFSRSTVMDLGCLAANSVARIDQTIAWVAHDRTVRLLQGYSGQRISTPAVERDIEALADKTTLEATSWTRDGHSYYQISSESWTWVYDSQYGWSNRESYGASNWRISTVTEAFGKVLCGDRDSPNVYEMSQDFKTEASSPLVFSVTLPPVSAYPHPLTLDALYIDVERGVGSGQGNAQDIDPEIMLEWSKDGGATWNGPRMLKIGKQGKRLTRVTARRLGQSLLGFTLRISCSAKVARAIYGVYAEIEKDAA
jgi:hypothetical protein